jgi:hypothetical protein
MAKQKLIEGKVPKAKTFQVSLDGVDSLGATLSFHLLDKKGNRLVTFCEGTYFCVGHNLNIADIDVVLKMYVS